MEAGVLLVERWIRLGKQYGPDRVEAAAVRALACDVRSYKSVKSILDSGLDKLPPKAETSQTLTLPFHSNIRGSDYYN